MDSDAIPALKTHVKRRIKELEQLLPEHGDDPGKGNNSPKGASSLLPGDDIAGAIDSQVLEKARREINILKDNLLWLESEDGGYCVECGSEIPLARLKAVPATRRCVHCAA